MYGKKPYYKKRTARRKPRSRKVKKIVYFR